MVNLKKSEKGKGSSGTVGEGRQGIVIESEAKIN